jgi:cell shape-determining protein MreC
MKKTYLPKHKRFFSAENFSCGVYALIFAILIFLFRIVLPNLFWKTFTPIFRFSDTLASDSRTFISGFGNAETLAAANTQLVQRNSELANENQVLVQKMSDISALGSSSGIFAGVVARPPESPYDTLVLAAGENDGITIGMEAFGENGVPLGTVSSVLPNFSRVTLFSAPHTATYGWIGNAHLPITIFGAGAGAMNATMPRSANITVGDVVFVPGPGALPIGKVARIDEDASSPSVTLHIVSSTNIFSTVWVLLRDTGTKVEMSATSTLP